MATPQSRSRPGQAASRGLQVGRGQTGGSLQLRTGIPAQIVQQLERLAHAVFTQSFVDAMRPSMALAITVVIVAAIGVLGVRARAGTAPATASATTELPASVA